MPARCRGLHHRLEFAHLAPELLARAVAHIGGEEANRVVSPVISKSEVEQSIVVDERIMASARRPSPRARAGGAPPPGGPCRCRCRGGGRAPPGQFRQPADVRFVNHGAVQRRSQRCVALPIEFVVDNPPRARAKRLLFDGRQVSVGMTELICEAAALPVLHTIDRVRVRSRSTT